VTYAWVLLACFLGTLPLEVVMGVRVYRSWRRLVLALVPVLVVFLTWDALAARAHQWRFDRDQVLGFVGVLPVEELAFFVVIPTCAVLALEAVRRARQPRTRRAAAAASRVSGDGR
jgi:lycopene cyclase domain-containing protein